MALTGTDQHDDGLFAQAPLGSRGPVVFLTNRYNLLQISSAALITPREAYGKYYADLLELSPGRIPLLRGPVSAELQALVSADDEAAFPVALELDPDQLSSAPLPSLMRDGRAGRAGLGDAECVAWAPTGVIPLSAVIRVLFRSERELEEHGARSYENIDPNVVRLEVASDVFTGETGGAEGVRRWLTELPMRDVPAASFSLADRLAGARALAIASLSLTPAAARAISRLFPEPFGSASDSSREGRPRIAEWAMLNSLRGEGRVPAGGDLNGRLFSAAAKTFRTVDFVDGWRPLEALASVERLVRARKLAKKDEGELTRNLDSIRGILRNERDFKPFKPGAGLDAAKALLMVLLRPEPTRLLAWSSEESGADAPVMFTAAVLCGLLNGRERLPVDLRSADLDAFLSEVAALELSSGEDRISVADRGTRSPLEVCEGANGSSSIVSGGVVLSTWKTAPRSTAELLLERDWSQPDEQQIAVELSQILGWTDCVRAQLLIESGEFTVSSRGRGKALALEVIGWPTIIMTPDIARFRERLSVDGVPVELDAKVRGRLAAATATPLER